MLVLVWNHPAKDIRIWLLTVRFLDVRQIRVDIIDEVFVLGGQSASNPSLLACYKGAVNAYFLTDSFSRRRCIEAAILWDSQKTG